MRSFSTLLIIAYCLLSNALFSQPARGRLLIGGAADISYHTNIELAGFGLRPHLQYFVSDRLALGGGVRTNFTFLEEGNLRSLSLLPAVRYYFSRTTATWHWFAEAQGGATWSWSGDATGSLYEAELRFGTNLFLCPDVAFEARLQTSYFPAVNLQEGTVLGLWAGLRFFLPVATEEKAPARAPEFAPGNWLAGFALGDIGLGFFDETTAFSVGLEPQAGYFVSRRTVLGAALDIGYADTDRLTTYQIGTVPFARYYLHPPSHRWAWFLQAGAGAIHQATQLEDDQLNELIDRRQTRFRGHAAIGGNFFLTPALALEGRLRYQYESISEEERDFSDPRSEVGLEIALTAFLGKKE